jgi:hypothetical protein
MRNFILVISLGLNLLVLAGVGFSAYMGYSAYKSATGPAAAALPGVIKEVYDVNDAGYLARSYAVDYAGMVIIVDEPGTSGAPRKVGDSVKIQAMKMGVAGMKMVNYSIVP